MILLGNCMSDTYCSICNTKAVIYLSYGKRSLCKKHFLRYFEKRVKRTVGEFGLVNGADHLGVALSGGKDSVTTLCLLKEITSPMKKKLTAITIDEGIKGYKNKTIRNAKEICEKLKVPLHIINFKKEIGFTMDEIMKKKRKKREVSCTYCGVFRRWILNKAAKELGIDRIAVGHNLDDMIQSFLMNLYRNEPFRLARFGPKGGIIEDEGFVPRIRPLFRIPEKEVALYALLKGFKFTLGQCPYLEEGFRHVIRSQINDLESKYPGTKFKLFNSYILIREILNKSFKEKPESKISKCKSCGEPTSTDLCKKCELLSSLNV